MVIKYNQQNWYEHNNWVKAKGFSPNDEAIRPRQNFFTKDEPVICIGSINGIPVWRINPRQGREIGQWVNQGCGKYQSIITFGGIVVADATMIDGEWQFKKVVYRAYGDMTKNFQSNIIFVVRDEIKIQAPNVRSMIRAIKKSRWYDSAVNGE